MSCGVHCLHALSVHNLILSCIVTHSNPFMDLLMDHRCPSCINDKVNWVIDITRISFYIEAIGRLMFPYPTHSRFIWLLECICRTFIMGHWSDRCIWRLNYIVP